MSELEFQDEEREALQAIYEGDEAFKQLSPTVFQYKYGEPDNIKSMLLEIHWGEKYPNEKPTINMDTFYNKHIKQCLKDKFKDAVLAEAEQYLGMSMTYSLFEYIKEKFDEFIEDQFIDEVELNNDVKELTIGDNSEDMKKKTPKKEQLTKAQKRKQWDRACDKGERPRGWDWVDIVKHLSQTGNKDDHVSTS
ncbi:hypothetical protein RN001_011817 [Aquatica leii]|uniref:RWD domain-containing protein n=1 Tax=Aquatica leii TaxID=1421715 RepID=A0AAN7NXT8_9COLE|nr:hypothetical protein RN001_011817 [Aquatica leii]